MYIFKEKIFLLTKLPGDRSVAGHVTSNLSPWQIVLEIPLLHSAVSILLFGVAHFFITHGRFGEGTALEQVGTAFKGDDEHGRGMIDLLHDANDTIVETFFFL